MKFFENSNLLNLIEIVFYKSVETKTKSIKEFKNILKININEMQSKITANEKDIDKGIWLISSHLHKRLLYSGYKRGKINNFSIFNPIKFANGILNSITIDIATYFNIRGYSNSYIFCDADTFVVEFLSTSITFAIVIYATEEETEIFFVRKNITC